MEAMALITSLLAGALVYLGTQDLLYLLPSRAGRIAAGLKGEERPPSWKTASRLLYPLSRLILRRSMESTAYWLQVLGWKEFEPLDMASLLLGSGVGAFLLLTLAGMDPFTTLLGCGLAPFLASMWVQNRVRKAVRAVQRELPYTVTRISLEVAQGRSLLAALQEASRGSGPMADLLRRCLARGMGILSAVIDELIGEAEKSGLRELKEFALILETLQRTPKGLSEVLLQIARDAATDYQNRAITSAEKLKTRLALQTVFTFLLPYVAYLMLPVGSRIVQLLSLG